MTKVFAGLPEQDILFAEFLLKKFLHETGQKNTFYYQCTGGEITLCTSHRKPDHTLWISKSIALPVFPQEEEHKQQEQL